MNWTRLSDGIARLVVRRPAIPAIAALLLALGSIFIVTARGQFDSNILNLLPSEFDAVRGLQIHSEAFEQSHELTFALFAEEEPERIDRFLPYFLERLEAQPWTERILDAPPMESAEGQEDLPEFGAMLVMNLPPEAFEQVRAGLEPEAVDQQLRRIHRGLQRGSPAAQFELQTDPLGVLRYAASELASEASLESTFDLRSPDRSVRVIPTVTNIPSDDPEACRQLMIDARAFMDRTTEQFDGVPPEVRVTGHAAYVDEISASMKRDLQLTSTLSLLAITFLFWIGFRSVLPLIGIALILSLAALYTLAGGMLLLGAINVIAIGFCSILLGLGNDFSLLYYNQYLADRRRLPDHLSAVAHAIREMTPGIVVVALTTAVGFTALAWSGSDGFAQLGLMIAAGVAIAVGIMPFLLFLFIRDQREPASDPLGWLSTGFTRAAAGSPRGWLAGAAIGALLVLIVALAPWRTLAFESGPRSLEPQDIPAARTLQRLLAAYPDAREPSLIIVEADTDEQLRQRVSVVTSRLAGLKAEGELESFASPRFLLPQPRHFSENAALLASLDLRQAGEQADATAAELGFTEESLAPAHELLGHLNELSSASGPPAWESILPTTSPWWFLLKRHLSRNSNTALIYITPTTANDTPEGRVAIAPGIQQGLDGVFVSGWSQTVAALQPWAARELTFFGSLVAGAIAVILLLVYRNPKAFLIHAASLAIAVCGTIATLKLLDQQINLLSVIAFPLMLAVGVDYGVHLILALRHPAAAADRVRQVLKPILISGLTTIAGFGALAFASNPSLSGLGVLCALGVAWSLASAILFVVPAGLCFLKPQHR